MIKMASLVGLMMLIAAVSLVNGQGKDSPMSDDSSKPFEPDENRSKSVVEIGSRLELFVDDWLIGKMSDSITRLTGRKTPYVLWTMSCAVLGLNSVSSIRRNTPETAEIRVLCEGCGPCTCTVFWRRGYLRLC